jgi:hypothetical protein
MELTDPAVKPIVEEHGTQMVNTFVSQAERAPKELRGLVIATAHSALTVMLMQATRNPELAMRVLIEAMHKGLSYTASGDPAVRARLVAVAHAAVTAQMMASTPDPTGFALAVMDALSRGVKVPEGMVH